MILNIRGYKIRCYAKHGNKEAYIKLYSGLSDDRLVQMEKETTNEGKACTRSNNQ